MINDKIRMMISSVTSMQIANEQQSFLSSVNGFNGRFNAVRTDESLHEQCHSLWNESEIAKSWQLLSDWGVPAPLVPFYGDWYTLICCLAPKEDAIKLLDDGRRILFTWPSISASVKSLLHEPEKPIDTFGIIGS